MLILVMDSCSIYLYVSWFVLKYYFSLHNILVKRYLLPEYDRCSDMFLRKDLSTMGRDVNDSKRKKIMISCSIDEGLNRDVSALSAETGASKSEILRRSIKAFCKDGPEDSLVILNMVCLMQTLNDMKDELPKESRDKLWKYADNIMKIKGGKEDGNI